ncbi:hypothetical protein ACQ7B2_19845, partial [Escherichia coli]
AEEADGWQDLLAPLTPEAVAQAGLGWCMEGGQLYSQGGNLKLLPLAGDYSGAGYRVRVRLRRLIPKAYFYLKLPVGDHEVGFVLDQPEG